MTRYPAKRRYRRTVVMMLAAALIASASLPTSALSLSLPLETPSVPVKTPPVKVPTVTVEVPPVTVKGPPVTVQTPPVTVKTPPVKTPTVPAKTPSVPEKTPTVPIKTPTVPVKAPVPTGSSNAPAVTVRTPNVSATAPGVSVKSGGASASASSGSTNGSSAPVASGTHSAGSGTELGPPRGSSEADSASSGSPAGTSAVPLASYGLGAGYEQSPASEGAVGTQARAHIAMRERNLKALVAQAQGCLTSLPEQQQRLLELRSGLGQAMPLNPAATAAQLHVGQARFTRLESRALRELRRVSTRGCGETTSAGAAAAVVAFLGSSFGDPQARGGVKAARYEAGPKLPLPPASAGDKGLLGTHLSSAASDAILAFVLVLLAGVATVAVAADSSGNGPRHAQWRRQMRNRIRSWH
jgi:hypothetical protein